MPKLPGYLTIKELAESLDVCHSTAASYVREKLIKGAVNLGGQKLIPQESLAKFQKPKAGNPNFRKRKRKSA